MPKQGRIDELVRAMWDEDLHTSEVPEVTGDGPGTLLRLPHAYVTPGGAEGTFASMFAWDTYFINRGLLAHDRLDLVRGHILNYLSMIERYGFMPNSNTRAALTRSQTPVFPDSVIRYAAQSGDHEILDFAYPLLVTEFRGYWLAPHHQTPIGLATAGDLGDPHWPAELAAEAETGLDWTPIWGGDVRRCAPLIINCAIVRYAEVLSEIATTLGATADAREFAEEASRRRELIDEYCWDDERGLYLEYDIVDRTRLPYVSACAYWPLWAGVPDAARARTLAESLQRLVLPFGLSTTDREYPDPHREGIYPENSAEPDLLAPDTTLGGRGQLQWMHPATWAPLNIIAVDGLDRYGLGSAADEIASGFLAAIVLNFETTGRLWEKYNALDGGLVLPNARYGNVPMHGWTAAAVALFTDRLANAT